jgi:hypothetical protein
MRVVVEVAVTVVEEAVVAEAERRRRDLMVEEVAVGEGIRGRPQSRARVPPNPQRNDRPVEVVVADVRRNRNRMSSGHNPGQRSVHRRPRIALPEAAAACPASVEVGTVPISTGLPHGLRLQIGLARDVPGPDPVAVMETLLV